MRLSTWLLLDLDLDEDLDLGGDRRGRSTKGWRWGQHKCIRRCRTSCPAQPTSSPPQPSRKGDKTPKTVDKRKREDMDGCHAGHEKAKAAAAAAISTPNKEIGYRCNVCPFSSEKSRSTNNPQWNSAFWCLMCGKFLQQGFHKQHAKVHMNGTESQEESEEEGRLRPRSRPLNLKGSVCRVDVSESKESTNVTAELCILLKIHWHGIFNLPEVLNINNIEKHRLK